MNPEAPRPEVTVPVADDSTSTGASTGPADALTRLLEELARTPESQIGQAWRKLLSPGEMVGRFELLRECGRGGFGIVYEARDAQLGRLVAFKALRPGRALDERQVDGLRREAEAAAQLNHPNVVTIHDFGTCPAGPYLIMEHLRGAALSQRLEPGPLPPREAVRIATEVAQALAHAHAHGVIHRDLKPGNVFLCGDGKVKVLDFGLARMLGGPGARGGTPGYMAPEQCRGEKEDERTDLFGLGVLLYRMLAAKLPFAVVNGKSTVVDDGPPPPEVSGKHVPPRLSALVGRLLAKDPAARPRAALEVLDELVLIGRALDPLVIARRHRRRLLATVAALLAAVAGGAAGLWVRLAGGALGQVTVAVADFANETGDPELDGLSGMLITSLEQSKRLTVLTRSRMRDELKQMGREDVPKLDETVAREIGRRLGTKALLLASIRRFDTAYAVEMRALDPVGDRYLFTVSEHVQDKAHIPELVDRVSAGARRGLQEAPGDVGGSRINVGEVFTRNLEAYRHYFLGVDCMDRPSQIGSIWQGCAEHFRRALAGDPGFALAHYQLAVLSGAELNDDKETRSHIEAAATRASSVPLKERLLILAWKDHVEGRDGDAIARYRQLLERYPDDKHALYLTGDLLHHQGDNEHAIPYMQKTLEIDPSFEWALDHLAIELVATDRLDELRAYVRRWEAMPPAPGTLHALARARFGIGDPAGALVVAQRYAALGTGAQGQRDVASVLFSSGDFRGAERVLRAAITAGSRDDFLPFMLVYALHAQGRAREALNALERLDPALRSGESATTYLYCRAVLLASGGAQAEARKVSRATAELDPAVGAELATDLALHGDLEQADTLAVRFRAGSSRYEVWQAVSAWKRGDLAGARSRLRALDRLDPVPDYAPMPSFVLAEIAADRGEDADVVPAVRRYQRFWAAGLRNSWTSPRAVVLLAQAQFRLGRYHEAQKTLDGFLTQWVSADRDHPLLRQAKALQAKLAEHPALGPTR